MLTAAGLGKKARIDVNFYMVKALIKRVHLQHFTKCTFNFNFYSADVIKLNNLSFLQCTGLNLEPFAQIAF